MTTTSEKKKGKRQHESTVQKGDEHPKEKKPRVKPEKALEVSKKILLELVKNYSFGENEIPMAALTLAVGYKNPRSDAIMAAIKLLKKDGLAQVKNKICSLTDKGIQDHVPPEPETPADPKEALDFFWDLLEKKLLNTKKCGKSTAEKAKKVWDLLMDGKPHSTDEVLNASGYSMVRSTGYPEMVKAMESLEFVEKKDKNFEFTPKIKALLH